MKFTFWMFSAVIRTESERVQKARRQLRRPLHAAVVAEKLRLRDGAVDQEMPRQRQLLRIRRAQRPRVLREDRDQRRLVRRRRLAACAGWRRSLNPADACGNRRPARAAGVANSPLTHASMAAKTARMRADRFRRRVRFHRRAGCDDAGDRRGAADGRSAGPRDGRARAGWRRRRRAGSRRRNRMNGRLRRRQGSGLTRRGRSELRRSPAIHPDAKAGVARRADGMAAAAERPPVCAAMSRAALRPPSQTRRAASSP